VALKVIYSNYIKSRFVIFICKFDKVALFNNIKIKANKKITFKSIRDLCLNLIQVCKHNNRTIYDIFIFSIIL